VKVGSFWSGNPARGLPRHNSTIVLLDQFTGRLGAVIEAGRVNAYRTAAADAVAADLLAREGAKILAIFGAGNQAEFEVMALARIRPIEAVLVVARPSPRRDAFLERITDRGLTARAASAEDAVRAADIVVTATPSREPLFRADWVGPGTHVVSIASPRPARSPSPSVSTAACETPDTKLALKRNRSRKSSVLSASETSAVARACVWLARAGGSPSPRQFRSRQPGSSHPGRGGRASRREALRPISTSATRSP
jgi:ornithine cyclodeaminase/alanine dehydrogenase-like protein (mu-crystallin family)